MELLDPILKVLGVLTTLALGAITLVVQGQRRKADAIAREQEERSKRFESLEKSCNDCRLGLEREFVRKEDQNPINRELCEITGNLRVEVGRLKK